MGLNARWPAPVLGWAVLLLAAGMYQATAQQMTLDDLAKPIPMTPGDFDLLREAGTFPIVLAFDQKAADAAGSELEGLARVMLVDVQEPDHLAHLGLEAGQLPTYRVFGYKADASASGQDFESLDLAAAAVRDSVPADLVKPLAEQAIEATLLEALNNRKLVAVLYTKKAGIPDVALKLAMLLHDSYTVQVVTGPNPIALQEGRFDKLPAMLVYFPTMQEEPGIDGQARIAFSMAAFDRARHGGFKFKNMVTFLALLRSELLTHGKLDQIWPEAPEGATPPPSPPSPAATKQFKEAFEITADVGRDYCPTNILGLCALVLLDGASPDLTAHLEVVRGAEALAREQGQVVHFMWADASCHPEFASHFGLAPDLLPAVVALAPKKGKHAVMRGGFEAASVNGFLAAVLRGRETLVDDDMNALPMAASGVDCAAVHAASLESLEEEEDFDLSDIMAEEVGDESERAALRDEAEAAAAAATLDSEEAEMAAKRRKAMEELERLNKKSQKKKKGKKGKKGKKKRKAAAKDEL